MHKQKSQFSFQLCKMRFLILFLTLASLNSIANGQFGLFKLPNLSSIANPIKSTWQWLNTKKELAAEEYSDEYYAKMSNKISLRSDDDEDSQGFGESIKSSVSNFVQGVRNPLDALESGRSLFAQSNTAAKAYIGCE